MELRLCGSRKYNGQEHVYWKLLREYIYSKSISRLLFIGTGSESHVGPDALKFFKEKLQPSDDLEIFDAEIENELANASGSAVYVLGGHKQIDLLRFIDETPLLKNAILTCPFYFGESLGAKIVGSKLRIGDVGTPLIAGLGILKDTIIEGHYSQKQRQKALRDEVKIGHMKYGLGIDEDAEVITTPESFPKFKSFGPGVVELISN